VIFVLCVDSCYTRSQAVARIADRTITTDVIWAQAYAGLRHVLKRPLNKGQGHAHFHGKLFVRLLGFSTKPHTKLEVSSSSSFGAIDAAIVDMTLNDL